MRKTGGERKNVKQREKREQSRGVELFTTVTGVNVYLCESNICSSKQMKSLN